MTPGRPIGSREDSLGKPPSPWRTPNGRLGPTYESQSVGTHKNTKTKRYSRYSYFLIENRLKQHFFDKKPLTR
jgi:hypothetical protein